MLISLKRIIKCGLLNLIREKETIFPTIFVLFLTVFFIGLIFLVKEIGIVLIDILREKTEISVYFKEDTKEEEIFKIREELFKIQGVKKVTYVPKEEALQKFIQRHNKNPVYLESLEIIGGNPFLASLNIKSEAIEGYELVNQYLEKEEIKKVIDHTSYSKSREVIEKIFSFTSLAKKIGIGISVIFLIVAILVNFNTIKLAILNSKKEIEIQKIVGATDWFIRGPFLVQSIIYGVLAVLLSISFLALICWFLGPRLNEFLIGIDLFSLFLSKFKFLFLIQFLIGIFLPIISTFLVTRRYLKI
jgi:cell division transport system permease protein